MSGEEEVYNYYFQDRLLSDISERFDMKRQINTLISSAKNKNANEIDALAREGLGRYLEGLSGYLVESQKESIEHTGEVIYQVAEKTGLRFPSIPQRLLELGFMGTRSQDRLSIIESTSKDLVLRISTCAAYTELRDKLGEERVKDLPCRYGCLANSKILFDQLKVAVQVEKNAKMHDKGYCEFAFRAE